MGNFVNLTDGTRIEIKVNFGTLYYMQKQKRFYRIAKKMDDGNGKKKKSSLTQEENFEMAAYIIYAVLRSNGKLVTFDEALSLMPMDTEAISSVLEEFKKEYDKYNKKKEAKVMRMPE